MKTKIKLSHFTVNPKGWLCYKMFGMPLSGVYMSHSWKGSRENIEKAIIFLYESK